VRPTTLLPERALAATADARRRSLGGRAAPSAEDPVLLDTLEAYLSAPSLEGAARALFVHPNTVRYRLRRVTDSPAAPTDPRGPFVLRLALDAGPAADGEPRTPRPIL
jgi:DNA-binding PucR family transcriptional regulator